MKSSFFELHVASSGLFTAKAGLNIVAHNIANAGITGYSRQYAIQSATTPLSTYNQRGMVGTGSEVTGIGQIRSLFLDKKYWKESGVLGQYQAKKTQLTMMEATFNEMASTGTGIASAVENFFAALQSLADNASEGIYAGNVISSAAAMTELINNTAQSLRSQQVDINTEIETVVARINSLGTQIARLNQTIANYEMDGARANDLRDQRALLIDELSTYVNIDVTQTETNQDFLSGKSDISRIKLDIMINGCEFVNNYDVNTLKLTPRSSSSLTGAHALDAANLYDITFANGAVLNVYGSTMSGELKGLIDVRDGVNAAQGSGDCTYKGIPYYLNKLTELVQTFAKAMNLGVDANNNAIASSLGGHVNGYNASADTTGLLFFTYIDSAGNEAAYDPANPLAMYSDMNCFNFKVNAQLIEDPSKMAASSSNTAGASNNDLLFGYTAIGANANLFKTGKIVDFLAALTSELGIDLQQATKFQTNYTDVVTGIDNQRLEVSAVSMNEEVLSMLQYQQQYIAAAKLMSVINEIYDVMINSMGV